MDFKTEEVYIKQEICDNDTKFLQQNIKIEIKAEPLSDGETEDSTESTDHFQPQDLSNEIDNNQQDILVPDTQNLEYNSTIVNKQELVEGANQITELCTVTIKPDLDDTPQEIPGQEQINIEIQGKVYENGKRNRLDCPLCSKDFKNRANLKNHLKYVHSDDNTVVCNQCFRTFKSHMHLRSHIESVHANTRQVTCDVCSKVFQNRKKLKNHIYFTHPQPGDQVTCDICQKTYKSSHNLKVHIKQVHPKGKSVKCPKCDREFKVSMLLQRHLRWAHPADGLAYKCQQCGKVLPSMSCYKKHVENAHTSGIVSCHICQREFKSKKSLDRHLRTLHNCIEIKTLSSRGYTCEQCDRTFTSNTSLYYHTQRYHTDITLHANNCQMCDKSFSDTASLQRHLSSVHSLETATCNICFKEFKSLINLQGHIRITHAPPEATQTCPICKKVFKCALHLRMHNTAVHNKGVYKCDECQKEFTTQKYLNRHKKTHISDREHACDICGKLFKNSFGVTKHKKAVHENVYCEKCGLKHGDLKGGTCTIGVIKKIVTKYSCDNCSDDFISKSDLQKHLVSCERPVEPVVKIEEN